MGEIKDYFLVLSPTSFTEKSRFLLQHLIKNVFDEHELDRNRTVANFVTVQNEGGRLVERNIDYYNLDVIISVGYRVKSIRGTQFRIWALKVLKDYLLKGYSVNQRIERLENRMSKTEEKIEFFVRTALPPAEGISALMTRFITSGHRSRIWAKNGSLSAKWKSILRV